MLAEDFTDFSLKSLFRLFSVSKDSADSERA